MLLPALSRGSPVNFFWNNNLTPLNKITEAEQETTIVKAGKIKIVVNHPEFVLFTLHICCNCPLLLHLQCIQAGSPASVA
jgi:hypothetical protein